jgi:hypothetical protein
MIGGLSKCYDFFMNLARYLDYLIQTISCKSVPDCEDHLCPCKYVHHVFNCSSAMFKVLAAIAMVVLDGQQPS